MTQFFISLADLSNPKNAKELSNRKRFPCLHNCREFAKPLECLYQDMQTKEKKNSNHDL